MEGAALCSQSPAVYCRGILSGGGQLAALDWRIGGRNSVKGEKLQRDPTRILARSIEQGIHSTTRRSTVDAYM